MKMDLIATAGLSGSAMGWKLLFNGVAVQCWAVMAVLVCLAVVTSNSLAADNELTAAEKAEGWRLLFDGKTLNGWRTSSAEPSKVDVQAGAINPHGCGAYMLVHDEKFGNFQLALDFKLSPKCNSGIFVRTFPLFPRPGKDVGYNGIEIALDDTTTAGFHDTGAIYDLVAPKKNAMKPVGEWNHAMITCNKNRIAVEINGELVTEMNLDEWTKPYVRPDGSQHKFDVVYREHPRRGFIGLQDHGSPVWFKNIKLRDLGK